MVEMSYTEEAQAIAQKTRSNKIIRYFPETDLRCNHLGLSLLAKEKKINVKDLAPGEFLVFTNKALNKLKIYAPGNCIAYVKSPDNRRIDLNVVRLIPRFFNGTKFDYEGAMSEMFSRKFG